MFAATKDLDGVSGDATALRGGGVTLFANSCTTER
jgi:hypothetical protein